MIHKKVHFPIFVLLALFLILQSCEKKTIKSTENQNDKAEIDALLKGKDVKACCRCRLFNLYKNLRLAIVLVW